MDSCKILHCSINSDFHKNDKSFVNFFSLGLKPQVKLNPWQPGNNSDVRILTQTENVTSLFSLTQPPTDYLQVQRITRDSLITLWLNYNYNQKHYLDLVIHTWRFIVLCFNKNQWILSTPRHSDHKTKTWKFHYFFIWPVNNYFKKRPVCQIYSLIYFCNISFTSFNVDWALLKTVWFNLLPSATFETSPAEESGDN